MIRTWQSVPLLKLAPLRLAKKWQVTANANETRLAQPVESCRRQFSFPSQIPPLDLWGVLETSLGYFGVIGALGSIWRILAMFSRDAYLAGSLLGCPRSVMPRDATVSEISTDSRQTDLALSNLLDCCSLTSRSHAPYTAPGFQNDNLYGSCPHGTCEIRRGEFARPHLYTGLDI